MLTDDYGMGPEVESELAFAVALIWISLDAFALSEIESINILGQKWRSS